MRAYRIQAIVKWADSLWNYYAVIKSSVVYCWNVVFLNLLSFSNKEISKKFGTLKVGSLAGREARSGAGICPNLVLSFALMLFLLNMLSFSNSEITKKFGTLKVGSLA